MTTFRFRLEAQDGSREFRTGAIAADSKEEARRALEERENAYVSYRLTTDELAEAKDDPGASGNKARLALHEQAKPYKITKLEEA